MKGKMGLALLCCVAVTSGCASITRGTKDVLVVESDPPGATVKLSTGLTGKTPAAFKLPRKDALVVTIKKDGYETVTVRVTSRVSGAGSAGMAGNIILGGLIGAAVDAGTGAMLDLVPNPIFVTLVPLRSPPRRESAAGTPKAAAKRREPPDDLRILELKLESFQQLHRNGQITDAEYEYLKKKAMNAL